MINHFRKKEISNNDMINKKMSLLNCDFIKINSDRKLLRKSNVSKRVLRLHIQQNNNNKHYFLIKFNYCILINVIIIFQQINYVKLSEIYPIASAITTNSGNEASFSIPFSSKINNNNYNSNSNHPYTLPRSSSNGSGYGGDGDDRAASGIGIRLDNIENSSRLSSGTGKTGGLTSVDGGPEEGVISSANLGGGGTGGHYFDKLDKLERSVAAVLIKVAYGTTSTTKRSIPDNSYSSSLTTIATPPLTTFRYIEKSPHQQMINLHHRNYELDLERDHALPTSAPNADILKSNSNPTYPNPNRHHNHERDRHRHLLNSTPAPSMHSLLKKGQPTIPMYPGDMPSYSPPSRSFFTPPLPPEYQSPFADKPTLRGTNNDAVSVVNTGAFVNRRPIPPPSLMPGHERIPLRPPDFNIINNNSGGNDNDGGGDNINGNSSNNKNIESLLINNSDLNNKKGINHHLEDGQRKKALNTPSQKINSRVDNFDNNSDGLLINSNETQSSINSGISNNNNGGRPYVPNISRILSSSNGKKEDIPEILLRKVTHPPSSPVKQHTSSDRTIDNKNLNINQSKILSSTSTGNNDEVNQHRISLSSSSSENRNIDDLEQDEPKTQPKITMSTKSTDQPPSTNDNSDVYSTQIINNNNNNNNFNLGNTNEKGILTTPSSASSGTSSTKNSFDSFNNKQPNNNNNNKDSSSTTTSSSSSNTNNNLGRQHGVATWTVAWNIHVYLSAILFTVLAVYSIFKMIFYDKLTHLFNQSYFICIHLILIIICMSRIFYLCYDAYNIHMSFHIFISEILLNLPATFLTIAFSILMLFLLIRSLNHKNNRYSALIRPLTVVVGSGVHVGLCVTLHYVESYTTNHNHYHYYYQYQQQQQHQQQQQQLNNYQQIYRNGYRNTIIGNNGLPGNLDGVGNVYIPPPPPPPPRVLSLICQIIYIFICLSLGFLYLYIYRILKRILRSKSQNYIHGYQNLSYAIHITIATALLFVLLAALQIYGAISISTSRPLITSSSEIDWLQWGYQFSLRLIEIAIITLMSWVAGLKTGGTSSVLQREKTPDNHNASGFALFPCTSSSSQEHFETDYPAICNANTNLHTYTLRTGKPIYDDNFALNSLPNNSGNAGAGNIINHPQNHIGAGGPVGSTIGPTTAGTVGIGGTGIHYHHHHHHRVGGNGALLHGSNDFQTQNSSDIRSYETSSLRSSSGSGHNSHSHHYQQQPQQQHHHHHHHHQKIHQSQILNNESDLNSDFITDSQTDHYENPNFELRSTATINNKKGDANNLRIMNNCYTEPLTAAAAVEDSMDINSTCNGIHENGSRYHKGGYHFQNYKHSTLGGGGGGGVGGGSSNSSSGSLSTTHSTRPSGVQTLSSAPNRNNKHNKQIRHNRQKIGKIMNDDSHIADI